MQQHRAHIWPVSGSIWAGLLPARPQPLCLAQWPFVCTLGSQQQQEQQEDFNIASSPPTKPHVQQPLPLCKARRTNKGGVKIRQLNSIDSRNQIASQGFIRGKASN